MNHDDFRVAVTRAKVTNRSIATALGVSEQVLYNKLCMEEIA